MWRPVSVLLGVLGTGERLPCSQKGGDGLGLCEQLCPSRGVWCCRESQTVFHAEILGTLLLGCLCWTLSLEPHGGQGAWGAHLDCTAYGVVRAPQAQRE